jgi:hypothetical protein
MRDGGGSFSGYDIRKLQEVLGPYRREDDHDLHPRPCKHWTGLSYVSPLKRSSLKSHFNKFQAGVLD